MLPDPNIAELLTWARTKLKQASDAPDIDAQRLLLHALKKADTSWLYAHNEERPTEQERKYFEQCIDRRSKGEPLAYILGSAEFYGRAFIVTPDVLIPRPETEELIRTALAYIQKHRTEQPGLVIADIGTGSGCIAITLACELQDPRIRIIATDISPTALTIAKRNADNHNVTEFITFTQQDMLEKLPSNSLNLIVSNPPYVPSAELNNPPTNETRGLAFEPRIALDGGVDGNTYIQEIIKSKIPAIIEGLHGNITTYNM